MLNRSNYTLAFEALWDHIPQWLVIVTQHIPTKRLKRLRDYMKVARRVAKSIVERQIKLHATGKEGGKDVMSILGQSSGYFMSFQDSYLRYTSTGQSFGGPQA